MIRAVGWVVCVLFVCGCGGDGGGVTDPEVPTPCLTATPACVSRVEVAGGVFLQVYRTHDLEAGDSDVTQAVIVVHGTNRNADNYYESMLIATDRAGQQDRTVVVAPRFQIEGDRPAADEAFWTNGGWKRGHLSRSEGPSPRVSSYTALDRIVEILGDATRFSALTRIVVTGHSAGGQVAHRYAATSRVEQALSGIDVRYVVANPSTYLYVLPQRWTGEAWELPDTGACPDYDEWHYGLEDRNTYASALEADSIRAQLFRRDVVILLGDADRGSASLDQSCGANLQGPHRYQRGLTLVDFMDELQPSHGHTRQIVPGVGHSSRSMFASAQGRGVLFEG